MDALLARCAATLHARLADFPELAEAVRPAPGPPLDAGDVRDARFSVVLRGYDIEQVDSLLARIADALPGDGDRPSWDDEAPTPVPTDAPELDLRKGVRGYDVEEVDAFLVQCAHSLGRRVERVPELAALLAHRRTGTPLRPRDVEVAQFHVRAWGYDIEQVDALLDRVVAALTG